MSVHEPATLLTDYLLAGFSGWLAWRLRRPWRGWMLAGIGLSIIAALVQQLGWAPAPHFNHNDLYHVIQALALGGFYRAGRKFAGPTGPRIHPG